jgi:hypothetical protein
MSQYIIDEATKLLGELDDIGVLDQSAYVLPLGDPGGDMTWKKLQAQQKREIQSGRWYGSQARHWLQRAMHEDNMEMLFKGSKLHAQAMYAAKGKESRLTKLPNLGGPPSKAEAAALLYEVACNIIAAEG